MAISVFDLFKIGIGPSSSHTVGPMRAAALFVQGLRERDLLDQVRRVEVQLYGSLSATGIGHGSDTATIMGLMGEWPDAIDPSQIGVRIHTLRETDTLLLDGRLPVPFVWARDMRLLDENLPFHPNAMTLVVSGDDGELHRDTYYSVGGGFVVDEAQAQSGVADMDRTELPYDFFFGAPDLFVGQHQFGDAQVVGLAQLQQLDRAGEIIRQLGATVMHIFGTAHVADGAQLIKQAHQRRAFHAGGLGDFDLVHTVAQAADHQQGHGAGFGNTVAHQCGLADFAPIAGAHHHAAAEVHLELFEGLGHWIVRIQLVC